jgi:uncharacterized protein (UPF0335 family)
MTTYLLRPEGAVAAPLQHFIERVERVGLLPLESQRLV